MCVCEFVFVYKYICRQEKVEENVVCAGGVQPAQVPGGRQEGDCRDAQGTAGDTQPGGKIDRKLGI